MEQRPKILTEELQDILQKLINPSPIDLDWMKCQANVWCELERVDMPSIGDVFGVYLIWHGGSFPRWVRIGQGNISERLTQHRSDPKVLMYKRYTLFVSWAPVRRSEADGVEAYLASQCNPLVGERFPDRIPISVNIPV